MRKWLVILMLMFSFMGTSVSNGSQKDNKEMAENKDVKQLVEWISTEAIGYLYLKENYNILQVNVPNRFPIEIDKLDRISDNYGMRIHPILRYMRPHNGIDIAAKKGTPILATANGTVDKVAYSVGYGKMVIIDHGNDVKTVYAHLKKFNVKKGQQVSKGDQIAELGSSGLSTGPHLHYEVQVKGNPINPLLMAYEDVETANKDIKKNYQILENYAKRNTASSPHISPEKSYQWRG